jgi:hypothetical protein
VRKARKRVIPLLAFFLMVALMPANVAAHTADEPLRIELIAGSGNEASAVVVGEVQVWNDGENLYVKYVTDGCWVILETHLQVADCLDDIPQTKKFNPIPGKFEYYSTELFEDGVIEKLYTIPLPEDWEAGDEFFIAAHAVVVKICDPLVICDISEPGVAAFGPMCSYFELDASEWDLYPCSAEATWVHPSWPEITDEIPDSEAEWISTAFHVENPVDDSWRKFHSEIELPEKGYYLTGSIVTATSDNAEEVYFNGDLVGSDGEVQGTFDDDHEWATFVEYPVEPVPGINHLDFIVRNYYQAGGNVESNPTGLIYQVCFNCYQEETAWGAGFDFEGKNWATYFTYELQDYVCPIIFAPIGGQQVVTGQILISQWANIEITGTVHIMVTYPYAGGPSYFPHLYVSTDGDPSEWEYDFEGYCVDTDNVIYQNTVYEVIVYECGDDLTGILDIPENIGYVQHILDQDWVGKPSTCDGVFTYGDVQLAIWTVIEDVTSTAGLGPWSQCRVDEILADAGWLTLTP